jgi:hypothetical protein
MARRLVCWLGVALGVAFLPAPTDAGEQRLPVSSHKLAMANPSLGGSQIGNARRSVVEVNAGARATNFTIHRAEVASLTFAKTTATPTTDPHAQTAKEQERNDTPGKRQTITFLRFTNSKLGEVSVQPVIGGGVNGAQLSIGF